MLHTQLGKPDFLLHPPCCPRRCIPALPEQDRRQDRSQAELTPGSEPGQGTAPSRQSPERWGRTPASPWHPQPSLDKAVCEGRQGCCRCWGIAAAHASVTSSGNQSSPRAAGAWVERNLGRKALPEGMEGMAHCTWRWPFCPSQGNEPTVHSPVLSHRGGSRAEPWWSRQGCWGPGRRAGLLWGLAEPARMAWALGWGPSFPLQHSSAGQEQVPSCPNQGMRNTRGFGLSLTWGRTVLQELV